MIVAIVLAAGLSKRMGKAKLLLPLDGKPLLRWSVEALRPHVDDLIVVVPPDDAAIRAALDELDVRFVTNPTPEAGQGASIAAGVRALAAGTVDTPGNARRVDDASAVVDAVIVALGDQPRLPEGLIRDLLRVFRASGRAIVAPVYRGVQGTPVLFGAGVFDELRALGGDAGARAVVRRDPARVAPLVVDADMPLDVDTPEDYARLV
jgi:molybdenum cofactor cytidylyltransferase